MLYIKQKFLSTCDVFSFESDSSKLNAKALCEMVLYGNTHLSIIDNRIVLEATISFIELTKRLN